MFEEAFHHLRDLGAGDLRLRVQPAAAVAVQDAVFGRPADRVKCVIADLPGVRRGEHPAGRRGAARVPPEHDNQLLPSDRVVRAEALVTVTARDIPQPRPIDRRAVVLIRVNVGVGVAQNFIPDIGRARRAVKHRDEHPARHRHIRREGGRRGA